MSAIGDAWARITYDLKTHPGTWIGIGVSGAVLAIAYLAYRNQLSGGTATSTGTVAGAPNYSSTGLPPVSATDNELQAEMASILQYLQSQQTPNSPGTAAPFMGLWNGTGVPLGPSGGVNTGAVVKTSGVGTVPAGVVSTGGGTGVIRINPGTLQGGLLPA